MTVVRVDGLRSSGPRGLSVIVADKLFASVAALESEFPAASNATKGAAVAADGLPRGFYSNGVSWLPGIVAQWEANTTGAGVYEGVLADCGSAAVDGDLAVDDNGTLYVLVVDSGGRVGLIPRSLSGGIVVGETHTAELVAHWYKEDPSEAEDVTEFASGGASISYDSGTGATTLQAGASDAASIGLGDAPVDADVIYTALLGATWAGTRSGAEGNLETRVGASSPYDRVRLFPEVSGTYAFDAGAGDGASLTGADPSTEHDVAFMWDGTTARGYYDSPAPAQDDAVPDPDGSGSGTPVTTTSAVLATLITVNDDASTPSLVCDGAYTIALTAIP